MCTLCSSSSFSTIPCSPLLMPTCNQAVTIILNYLEGTCTRCYKMLKPLYRLKWEMALRSIYCMRGKLLGPCTSRCSSICMYIGIKFFLIICLLRASIFQAPSKKCYSHCSCIHNIFFDLPFSNYSIPGSFHINCTLLFTQYTCKFPIFAYK